MAKTNFNFQATLKLRTDEFRKGVKDIQKTLNGLKQSFLNFAGAIGISLGLGKFVSMLKDTALQLDTAQNVLKNVSNSTVEYAESLSFLRKISNDYGQDLIVLTNNFAQFRAAARDSGLQIGQLRDIYDSLAKAAGAYHMSADRTNDMMNAVTQMFSKGKVAAEELRRQLGNSLPGAFNIMAKAAQMAGKTTNGTTAELEEAMRKGEILAKDVMPAFATVLNAITAGANFNSLQQSITRLGNTWTRLVEKMNVRATYQGFVDGLEKGLNGVINHLNELKALLKGGLVGLLGGSIWSRASKAVSQWSNETANAITKNSTLLERYAKSLDKFDKGRRGRLTPLSDYAKNGKAISWYDMYARAKNGGYADNAEELRKAQMAALKYNQTLLQQDRLLRDLTGKRLLNNRQLQVAKRSIEQLSLALATNGEEAVKAASGWRKFTGTIKSTLRNIGEIIKSAFSTIAITAFITAIISAISWIRNLNKEAKRINKIVEEATAPFKEKEGEQYVGPDNDDIRNLEKFRSILKQAEKDSVVWKSTIGEINKLMGLTGDNAIKIDGNLDDILEKLDEWIKDLREIAKAKAIIAKIEELTAKNIGLEAENATIRNTESNNKVKGYNPQYQVQTNELKGAVFGQDGRYGWGPKFQVEQNTKEIAENTKAIDELSKMLNSLGKEDPSGVFKAIKGEVNEPNSGITSGKTKTKLDEVNKVFDDYNDKLSKLNNQLKAGAITLDNYNDEYDKLIKDTYKSATEFGNLDEYLKGFDRQKVKGLKDKLEWLKLLFSTLDDDVNDDDRFKQIGSNLLEKIEKEIADGAEKAAKNRRNAYEAQGIYRNLGVPTERDTSFDYKKNDKEKLDEEYELMKDYLETLKDARNRLIELGQTGTEQFEQLNRVIGEVAGTVTNFADRAKLAEWKEDIKELAKAYQDELYNSVKNVTSSIDRLYRLYAEMAEMFGEEIDPDNGFAKMLTVVAALMDTFETIYTVIQSINALTEAASALEKAKDNAKMRALEEQIGLTAALGTAQVTASEAATAALVGETVAAKALGEALKNVAAGAATANAMSVPYPGNLAALASNMAAIAAAYGSIKAFAKGGLVNSPSKSGDRNLIRVNGDEMVLTRGQQGTLFNAIKSGNLGGGGQVEFKISGQNLVGVLKNYNQKMHG
jgi:tape measure domain-containing protein